MAEQFQLEVSLATPASDLVLGGLSNSEGLFARGGNDFIYADDPITSKNQKQNIDFLFGDIFDNSAQEYEIILNIQNTAQGGNPLLILDRNIPSVGADKFVLGDGQQPYYTSTDPAALTTTNLLGLNEYAVIYDFNPSQDTIQLNGKREDYRLIDVNGLKVEGIQQPFSGKAIFSLQQGAPDLLAYVIQRPDVKLDLKDKNFEFVGSKPPKKPTERTKIGQLGTTGNDRALSAATDSSGNVYITGTTNGPLFGTSQGLTDAWIAKYDNNGNLLWGKQFGTNSTDEAWSISTDPQGNLYLAGATAGNLFSSKQSQQTDAWVAKFDSNGNQLWGKQFGAGGFSNGSFALDVDAAGNAYLSGLAIKENQRTDIFNFAVQDDSFVTKFDTNGNQQWTATIGSFFFDETYDIAVDKDGNSYAVGWTQGLVGAGGTESDPERTLLKYDAWVAKVNPAGQIDWVRQLGSTNQGLDFGWGVDTDSKGNVYLTGWTTGEIGTIDKKSGKAQGRDIWLAKLTPDGTKVWTKQFGSPGDDGMYASDLLIDSKDNIFLVGETNDKLGKGQKDGTYNAWVGKFDTDGNNKWLQQFGSKNYLDFPTSLAADGTGKLYVTGFTDGLLGGNTTGTNTSAVDAWLAQLDVEKGKLQKFIGDGKDINSIPDPGAISTIDVTNELVTSDKLPSGDNRNNPAEGITVNGSSTFSYGQFNSNLGNIFNPDVQNSFPKTLANAVNNGTIKI